MDAYLHMTPAGMNTTLKELHGRPSLGGYHLNFRIQFLPTEPPDFAGAHMLVQARIGAAFGGGGAWPIGSLQLEHPIVFPGLARRSQVVANAEFAIDLSHEQLEALEKERSAGPIQLHFDLQGVVVREPGQVQALKPRFRWVGLPRTKANLLPRTTAEAFWGNISFDVTAAQWVKVLEELRYAQGFLVQVPRIDGGTSPKAADAVRRLEQAVTAMNEGRYKDAVSECRDLLEAVYGSADPKRYPDFAPTFPKQREADKAVRFWLIRQALLVVAHAAKHQDEVTAEITWERKDVAAVISALAALVQQDTPL